MKSQISPLEKKAKHITTATSVRLNEVKRFSDEFTDSDLTEPTTVHRATAVISHSDKPDAGRTTDPIMSAFGQMSLTGPTFERSPFQDLNDVQYSGCDQAEGCTYQSPTRSRPLDFSSLPVEVIELIIRSVYMLSNGKTRSGLPLKSLAMVDQKLHHLCAPWLWKNLTFPTKLSAPLEFLIEQILAKRWKLVKSLSMSLSSRSWNHNVNPRFDNTGRQLSPFAALSIIRSCPSLSELKLQLPPPPYTGRAIHFDSLQTFTLQLCPIISSLYTLRHLDLEDQSQSFEVEIYVIPLLNNLPLLESFSCRGFTQLPDDEVSSNEVTSDAEDACDVLGLALSQLRHLYGLHLREVHNVDPTWKELFWPQTLTDLTIEGCLWISHIEFRMLVHHFSPNLTRLKYVPETYKDKDKLSPLPDQIFSEPIVLPQLEELELTVEGWNSLTILGFRGCKSLRRLIYTYKNLLADFPLLTDSISTWAALKFVQLTLSCPDGPHSRDDYKKFRTSCFRAGIQLVDNVSGYYNWPEALAY